MDSLLVRLKGYDPRRGYRLRTYSFKGICFREDRGWYRVPVEVGTLLKSVRQVADDANAPLAFDVCTDDEAKALDATDEAEARQRRHATDQLPVTPAREDEVPVRPRSGAPSKADRAKAAG